MNAPERAESITARLSSRISVTITIGPGGLVKLEIPTHLTDWSGVSLIKERSETLSRSA